MKCAICKHGYTTLGFTTIVLEKNESTLVYKRVPAKICANCGEAYVTDEVNRQLLNHAKYELKKGVMLELLNFAA